ncbi:MAG: hypothetical protein ABR587_00580 [Candidatus Binatia bacterium]
MNSNAVSTCSGVLPLCATDAECVDDGNLCTDELCDPLAPSADVFGCVRPDNTNSCDDSASCTTGDTCGAGVCAGATNPCDDSNFCTTDSCDEDLDACVNTANVLACDDGSFCTTGNFCEAGLCGGVVHDCNDSNICTSDSCDEDLDAYVNVANALPCDDGLFCNGDDACTNGACAAHSGDPCLGGEVCGDSCNEIADDCFDVAGSLCCAAAGSCDVPESCSGVSSACPVDEFLAVDTTVPEPAPTRTTPLRATIPSRATAPTPASTACALTKRHRAATACSKSPAASPATRLARRTAATGSTTTAMVLPTARTPIAWNRPS